jgi:hypothetical protein
MNGLIWTIAITISIAGMFLIFYPAPNVAHAYSCSSGSSTSGGQSQSGVSGTKGSCSTSATTSTCARRWLKPDNTLVGPNTDATGVPAMPGLAQSFSSGGAQSSCSSSVGGHPFVQSNAISTQGSCSTHSP